MGIKAADLPMDVRERMGISAQPVNKYRVSAKDTRTTDGITFASKAEMHRYRHLVLMQKAGHVRYFLRQPQFDCGGGVRYIADFMVVYADGRIEYEDVKGMRTREYINKVKQVAERYPGITIREVEV